MNVVRFYTKIHVRRERLIGVNLSCWISKGVKIKVLWKKSEILSDNYSPVIEWRRLSPYFTVTSRCARDSKRYKIKKYPLKQINTMI